MLRHKLPFLFSLFLVACNSREAKVLPIDMIGTWQSVKGATFEYWTAAESGMRGMNFSAVDSSLRPSLQEKLEIYTKDGGLVFVAEPLNKNKTEFKIVESSRSHFRAENEYHDFPKWISYAVNESRDTMRAKIGDNARTLDFLFVKSRK